MLFLVLLGIAWALVVLPAILRSRKATPLAAAEGFKRRMEMIAPARSHAGRWVVVPKSHSPKSRSYKKQQARRRQTFQGLIGLAVLSLAVALWRGGVWWEAHLLCDGFIGIYVSYLLAAKRQREDVARKVRPLVPRRAPSSRDVTFYEPARASGGRR